MNDVSENHMGMGGTNQENITHLFTLTAHNLHQQSLHVHWATDDTGKEIMPHPHINAMHARVTCIDNLAFIGSSVLDKQSAYHSRECDVIMQSDELCETYLTKVFLPHFNKGKDARQLLTSKPPESEETTSKDLSYTKKLNLNLNPLHFRRHR